MHPLEEERTVFLAQFTDFFLDSFPNELSPQWLEDHQIGWIPRSSSLDSPSYRVSLVQQERSSNKSMNSLEKGLI